MIVELSQIPSEGLQVAFQDAFHLGEAGGVSREVCPVEADIHLMKMGIGVAVRGHFQARVGLTCSRCLEPFAHALGERFEVQYLPAADLANEDERELSGADLDVAPLVEDRIDLAALLRENILLGLPVQPLCREGCRGLCPRCGANLNVGPCGCAPQRPDPRLQVLAKLKFPRPPGA